MRLLVTLILLAQVWPEFLSAQQHPVAFMKATDIAIVKQDINKYPLLKSSFEEIKSEVDPWLNKDVDVPFPKDPAGGYTHDKHKNNYMLMFNAGILYNLTGNAAYAKLVKNMFEK